MNQKTDGWLYPLHDVFQLRYPWRGDNHPPISASGGEYYPGDIEWPWSFGEEAAPSRFFFTLRANLCHVAMDEK